MTEAEKILWNNIGKKQLSNHKFRRQYSIKGFVIDFYCPILKLAIEIDGYYHLENDAIIYDRARQKLLESLGIKFLRFSNDEVFGNIDKVINQIKTWLPPYNAETVK